MRLNTQQIVQRIGETDQLFLSGNSPELALERADLRLQLVTQSSVRQEQVHFLQEAVVLLEQGRSEFDEMPLQLYLDLSLHLAKAYMMFFEITQETRYSLITQQILKPLIHAEEPNVLFFLAYASATKNEPAFTQHWLKKYLACADYDLELLAEHPAFDQYRKTDWFKDLMQSKFN